MQSNGVAEWLKIALAEELGVCAATRVALPARFLWEAYRGMLGRERVPRRSPFDKEPLTWRLMRLLPALLDEPAFAPLRHFLADGDPERRLQLAERLADLFDQYQVYRADWLADWAGGRDQLRRAARRAAAAGAGPALAGAALARGARQPAADAARQRPRRPSTSSSSPRCAAGERAGRRACRAAWCCSASRRCRTRRCRRWPRWRATRRCCWRCPTPASSTGATSSKAANCCAPRTGASRRAAAPTCPRMPLEDLHAHSHPLLAELGPAGARLRPHARRIRRRARPAPSASPTCASTCSPTARATPCWRRCRPRSATCCRCREHPQRAARRRRPLDRIPRRPQRAARGRGAARPAAVVVRARTRRPAPARRGRDGAGHRHLFGRDPRRVRPAPAQRPAPHPVRDRRRQATAASTRCWSRSNGCCACRSSAAARAKCATCSTCRRWPRASAWPRTTCRCWAAGSRAPACAGAWTSEHRDGLGLGAAGEQNTWIFGVRRMLLGYASGAGASFARHRAVRRSRRPRCRAGRLAGAAGRGAAATGAPRWRERARPAEWGERRARCWPPSSTPRDEADRLTLAQLDEALQGWLETCDSAGFDEAGAAGGAARSLAGRRSTSRP